MSKLEREASHAPCATCPWLTANHGKPHPHKWYSLANRRRLWKGTRDGEKMSCHPTDPDNEVPEGASPVPKEAKTRECAGLLILQQREAMRFQVACKEADAEKKHDGLKRYRKAHPGGLLRSGVRVIVERSMFSGTVLGGLKMAKPDLNALVSHDDLTPWTEGKSDVA